MYSGNIHGTGPRYCPSIEDKIVRFADKERHQLFVEPMGYDTEEMYIQGFSTSLPVDVQHKMLASLTGFHNAEIMRYAYAIEYDCADPTQLYPTLEFKNIRGLYGAGQFNGTSGYEEAAAQRVELTKTFAYILALSDDSGAEIYRIQRNVDDLISNLKNYVKNSYSRQRIKAQLEYLSALLDTRISMQLIADNEWDPEKNSTRPAVAILANPSSATLPPCEHACEICGRCGDSESDSIYCVNKCNGHDPDHACVSVCPECNLCFNAECFEAVCADKCQGHHECESICSECGKCTDSACTEAVCADKCQGHKVPDDGGEDVTPDDSNKQESDKNESDDGEELGFFAKIWKAIVDFFKRLFGLE